MACDDALKKASFRRQMAADQIIVTFKLKAKVNLHTTNFEWDWSKSTSPQKICRHYVVGKSEITNLLHSAISSEGQPIWLCKAIYNLLYGS